MNERRPNARQRAYGRKSIQYVVFTAAAAFWACVTAMIADALNGPDVTSTVHIAIEFLRGSATGAAAMAAIGVVFVIANAVGYYRR